MKNYIPILVLANFFIFNLTMSQNSNLESFFIEGKNKTAYLGYVEPISEQTTSKAKILVFPVVTVKKTDVLLEDETGKNIENLNEIDGRNLMGRVSVKIDINDLASNKPLLNKLMFSFHPDITEHGLGIIEKPIKKEIPCPEFKLKCNDFATQRLLSNINSIYTGDYFQQAALYQQQEIKVNSKLSKYRVVPVFPRGLKFTILINGNEVSTKQFSLSSSVNSGSIFDIPIPTNLSPSTYRNLIEGEFLIQTEFQFLSSRFQSASAVVNLKGHTSYFVQAFKQAISEVSSTSSGILFWESTQKKINEFIQERSNESLSSENVQNYEYRLYDVENESLIRKVEDFLFPETTLNDIILNHKQAAQKARDSDNAQLAKVHEDYATLLEGNRNNLVQAKHVDVAKAMSSLANEDYLGFIANGFAFGVHDSDNSFTFRKMVNRNFSESETKTFSALIFKTLYQEHLISQKPAD
nr:hypothetical protein [uncultured Psychroserpens sp.]